MANIQVIKFYDIDQENNVIEFFVNKLLKDRKAHYAELFKHLALNPKIKHSFHQHTRSQQIRFFKTKPLYFNVLNDYVYLQAGFLKPSGKVYPKISGAVNFLLRCFNSVDYLDIKKVIMFIFDDIARYIYRLSSENEKALLGTIPNVLQDRRGILTLFTPCEIRTEHVPNDKKILLVIICYLVLYGKTFREHLLEKIKTLAPIEFDLIFKGSSVKQQRFLESHNSYFQISKAGVVQLYEHYASYKCYYQGETFKSIPPRDFHSEITNELDLLQKASASSSPRAKPRGVFGTKTNLDDILKRQVSKREKAKPPNVCLRFNTSVQFLLTCFESLHHLEMTETICFVLTDVGVFLLGMSTSLRKETFSKVPFTAMDDLGFLQKKEAISLNLEEVTKDELLLLFIVYHLSLNGKSHFEKVVKDIKNRSPQVISMILSSATPPGQLGYLQKYSQYFHIDNDGHLELPRTFVLQLASSGESSDDGGSSQSNADDGSVSGSSCDGVSRSGPLPAENDSISNYDVEIDDACEVGLFRRHSVSLSNSQSKYEVDISSEMGLSKQHSSSLSGSDDSWCDRVEPISDGDAYPSCIKGILKTDVSLSKSKSGRVQFVDEEPKWSNDKGLSQLVDLFYSEKGADSKYTIVSSDILSDESDYCSQEARLIIQSKFSSIRCLSPLDDEPKRRNDKYTVISSDIPGGYCPQEVSQADEIIQSKNATIQKRNTIEENCSSRSIHEIHDSICRKQNKSSSQNKPSLSPVSQGAECKKNSASKRLISGTLYLLKFFKAKKIRLFLRAILLVLKDVCTYFDSLSVADKKEFIKGSFALCIMRKNHVDSSLSAKYESLLSQQEKELLFFCYSTNNCDKNHYRKLYDSYFELDRYRSDLRPSDSDMLSYFKEFKNFFIVRLNGNVRSCRLPNLGMPTNFFQDVFESSSDVLDIPNFEIADINTTTKESNSKFEKKDNQNIEKISHKRMEPTNCEIAVINSAKKESTSIFGNDNQHCEKITHRRTEPPNSEIVDLITTKEGSSSISEKDNQHGKEIVHKRMELTNSEIADLNIAKKESTPMFEKDYQHCEKIVHKRTEPPNCEVVDINTTKEGSSSISEKDNQHGKEIVHKRMELTNSEIADLNIAKKESTPMFEKDYQHCEKIVHKRTEPPNCEVVDINTTKEGSSSISEKDNQHGKEIVHKRMELTNCGIADLNIAKKESTSMFEKDNQHCEKIVHKRTEPPNCEIVDLDTTKEGSSSISEKDNQHGKKIVHKRMELTNCEIAVLNIAKEDGNFIFVNDNQELEKTIHKETELSSGEIIDLNTTKKESSSISEKDNPHCKEIVHKRMEPTNCEIADLNNAKEDGNSVFVKDNLQLEETIHTETELSNFEIPYLNTSKKESSSMFEKKDNQHCKEIVHKRMEPTNREIADLKTAKKEGNSVFVKDNHLFEETIHKETEPPNGEIIDLNTTKKESGSISEKDNPHFKEIVHKRMEPTNCEIADLNNGKEDGNSIFLKDNPQLEETIHKETEPLNCDIPDLNTSKKESSSMFEKKDNKHCKEIVHKRMESMDREIADLNTAKKESNSVFVKDNHLFEETIHKETDQPNGEIIDLNITKKESSSISEKDNQHGKEIVHKRTEPPNCEVVDLNTTKEGSSSISEKDNQHGKEIVHKRMELTNCEIAVLNIAKEDGNFIFVNDNQELEKTIHKETEPSSGEIIDLNTTKEGSSSISEKDNQHGKKIVHKRMELTNCEIAVLNIAKEDGNFIFVNDNQELEKTIHKETEPSSGEIIDLNTTKKESSSISEKDNPHCKEIVHKRMEPTNCEIADLNNAKEDGNSVFVKDNLQLEETIHTETELSNFEIPYLNTSKKESSSMFEKKDNQHCKEIVHKRMEPTNREIADLKTAKKEGNSVFVKDNHLFEETIHKETEPPNGEIIDLNTTKKESGSISEKDNPHCKEIVHKRMEPTNCEIADLNNGKEDGNSIFLKDNPQLEETIHKETEPSNCDIPDLNTSKKESSSMFEKDNQHGKEIVHKRMESMDREIADLNTAKKESNSVFVKDNHLFEETIHKETEQPNGEIIDLNTTKKESSSISEKDNQHGKEIVHKRIELANCEIADLNIAKKEGSIFVKYNQQFEETIYKEMEPSNGKIVDLNTTKKESSSMSEKKDNQHCEKITHKRTKPPNFEIADFHTTKKESCSISEKKANQHCKEIVHKRMEPTNCEIADLNTAKKECNSIFVKDNQQFKEIIHKETEPPEIWCKNHLLYQKLCTSVTFVLHAFGPLHYTHLKKCISHVLQDIGIFLNGLSTEKQLEVFSSIPSAKLRFDYYMQLTVRYAFDTSNVSKFALRLLFMASYLALHGKTHYSKLLSELYQSVPEVAVDNFSGVKDSRWVRYFKNSSSLYFDFGSSGNLSLPPSYGIIDSVNSCKASQAGSSIKKKSFVAKPNTQQNLKMADNAAHTKITELEPNKNISVASAGSRQECPDKELVDILTECFKFYSIEQLIHLREKTFKNSKEKELVMKALANVKNFQKAASSSTNTSNNENQFPAMLTKSTDNMLNNSIQTNLCTPKYFDKETTIKASPIVNISIPIHEKVVAKPTKVNENSLVDYSIQMIPSTVDISNLDKFVLKPKENTLKFVSGSVSISNYAQSPAKEEDNTENVLLNDSNHAISNPTNIPDSKNKKSSFKPTDNENLCYVSNQAMHVISNTCYDKVAPTEIFKDSLHVSNQINNGDTNPNREESAVTVQRSHGNSLMKDCIQTSASIIDIPNSEIKESAIKVTESGKSGSKDAIPSLMDILNPESDFPKEKNESLQNDSNQTVKGDINPKRQESGVSVTKRYESLLVADSQIPILSTKPILNSGSGLTFTPRGIKEHAVTKTECEKSLDESNQVLYSSLATSNPDNDEVVIIPKKNNEYSLLKDSNLTVKGHVIPDSKESAASVTKNDVSALVNGSSQILPITENALLKDYVKTFSKVKDILQKISDVNGYETSFLDRSNQDTPYLMDLSSSGNEDSAVQLINKNSLLNVSNVKIPNDVNTLKTKNKEFAAKPLKQTDSSLLAGQTIPSNMNNLNLNNEDSSVKSSDNRNTCINASHQILMDSLNPTNKEFSRKPKDNLLLKTKGSLENKINTVNFSYPNNNNKDVKLVENEQNSLSLESNQANPIIMNISHLSNEKYTYQQTNTNKGASTAVVILTPDEEIQKETKEKLNTSNDIFINPTKILNCNVVDQEKTVSLIPENSKNAQSLVCSSPNFTRPNYFWLSSPISIEKISTRKSPSIEKEVKVLPLNESLIHSCEMRSTSTKNLIDRELILTENGTNPFVKKSTVESGSTKMQFAKLSNLSDKPVENSLPVERLATRGKSNKMSNLPDISANTNELGAQEKLISNQSVTTKESVTGEAVTAIQGDGTKNLLVSQNTGKESSWLAKFKSLKSCKSPQKQAEKSPALNKDVSSEINNNAACVPSTTTEEYEIIVPKKVNVPEKICTRIQKGIKYLVNYFGCIPDFYLVCVVLHVLYEAKYAFLRLPDSDQIKLVKKILAAFKDSGEGSVLDAGNESMDAFQLSKEHEDLLAISYIISKSNRINCNNVVKKLKPHQSSRASIYFRSQSKFFVISRIGFIKLKDFPPIEWKPDRLFPNVTVSSKDNRNCSAAQKTSIDKDQKKKVVENEFIKTKDIAKVAVFPENVVTSLIYTKSWETADKTSSSIEVLPPKKSQIAEEMKINKDGNTQNPKGHVPSKVAVFPENASASLRYTKSWEIAEKTSSNIEVLPLKKSQNAEELKTNKDVDGNTQNSMDHVPSKVAVFPENTSASLRYTKSWDVVKKTSSSAEVFPRKPTIEEERKQNIDISDHTQNSVCHLPSKVAVFPENVHVSPTDRKSVDIAETTSSDMETSLPRKPLIVEEKKDINGDIQNSEDHLLSKVLVFPENVCAPLTNSKIFDIAIKPFTDVKWSSGKPTIEEEIEMAKNTADRMQRLVNIMSTFTSDISISENEKGGIIKNVPANAQEKSIIMNWLKNIVPELNENDPIFQKENWTIFKNALERVEGASLTDIALKTSLGTEVSFSSNLTNGIKRLKDNMYRLPSQILSSKNPFKKDFKWLMDRVQQESNKALRLLSSRVQDVSISKNDNENGGFNKNVPANVQVSSLADTKSAAIATNTSSDMEVASSKNLTIKEEIKKMEKFDDSSLLLLNCPINSVPAFTENVSISQNNEKGDFSKNAPANVQETCPAGTKNPDVTNRTTSDIEAPSAVKSTMKEEIKKTNLSADHTQKSDFPFDKEPTLTTNVSENVASTSSAKEVPPWLKDLINILHGSIVFLIRYFALKACSPLLWIALHSLKSCSLFLQLPHSQQEEVIKACLTRFHICSRLGIFYYPDFVLGHKIFELSEEDKKLVFMSCLIQQAKKMHCLQVFKKYEERMDLKTHLSDCDQFRFFEERKDLFIIGGDGFVRLDNVPFVDLDFKCPTQGVFSTTLNRNVKLRSFKIKRIRASPLDIAPLDAPKLTSLSIVLSNDTNSDSKADTKGSIRLTKCSACQCDLPDKDAKNSDLALVLYNRIIESIEYLRRMFEFVTKEDLIRSVLYVLNDVRMCLVDESDFYISTLESLDSYLDAEISPLLKDTTFSHLLDLERTLLMLICILVHFGPMHYLKLFEKFGDKSLTSRQQYEYLAYYREYFVIDDKGEVNYVNSINPFSNVFKLDEFLEDIKLKTSFQSALIAGTNKTKVAQKETLLAGTNKTKVKQKATLLAGANKTKVTQEETLLAGTNKTKVAQKKTLLAGTNKTKVAQKATLLAGTNKTKVKQKATLLAGANKTKVTQEETLLAGTNKTKVARKETLLAGTNKTKETLLAGTNKTKVTQKETLLAGMNKTKVTQKEMLLAGTNKTKVTQEETGRRKFKVSLGCVQQDVLYSISDICDELLGIEDEPIPDESQSLQNTESQGSGRSDPKNSKATKKGKGVRRKNIWIQRGHKPRPSKAELSEISSRTVSEAKSCFWEEDETFCSKFIELFAASSQANPNKSTASETQAKVKKSRAAPIVDTLPVQSSEESPLTAKANPNKSTASETQAKVKKNQTAPIVDMLPVQSSEESPLTAKVVKSEEPKEVICDCNCTKDSSKEIRAINFFIAILCQSKIGVSVPDLASKLLLAPPEVQHYISSVYNGDILLFLQNHAMFYISPMSGAVYWRR